MSSDSAALSAKQECRVGGYELLSPIGKGSFSKVMLARHLVTGAEVAVKIINKYDFPRASQEAAILQKLSHPNIIQLFQVVDTDDQKFLFMEHMPGGHLFGYLRKNGPMAEADARPVFRQMTSAIQYCHHQGVIHRDLKPGNILLDGENNIKVADFGISTEFSDNELQTFCGTVSYMAPEVLKFQPYDRRKVDSWSLGVILYKMLTGKLPFERTSFENQKQQIIRGHFCIPDSLSVECQELLKKLLTVDPSQRASLEGIMKDQWVNVGYEEALRPYSEPPRGDVDPRVVEIMEKLGYKKEDIEESVSQRTFDDIMGTYMILQNRQHKMMGRTIRVRPCPAPDPSTSLCATQGAWALGQNSIKCSSLPCYIAARVPSPPPCMERGTCSLPPILETSILTSSRSLETKRTVATDSRESRMTVSPSCPWPRMTSPQVSLGGTMSIPPGSLDSRVTSSRPSPGSRTTAPTAHSSSPCTQPVELDVGTPASPSGPSRGRQGVARRVLRIFLRCFCFSPSTKKQHHKRKRVKPI